MSRLALAAVALALMAGCAGAPGADSDSTGAATPARERAPLERLGDFVHLLRKARDLHAEGEGAAAEAQWVGAHAIYRDRLAPILRVSDGELALELEYRIGRVGTALRSTRGKPKRELADLEELLVRVRPALEAVDVGVGSVKDP